MSLERHHAPDDPLRRADELARILGQGHVWITAEELAAFLQVSVRTIWRLKAAGLLPEPCAGLARWSPSEILAWEAAGSPDLKTWSAIRAAQLKASGRLQISRPLAS